MKAHTLHILDDSGKESEQFMAYVRPASVEDAAKVIYTTTERSEWMWVTLQNGDLMLATFPEGDLCEEMRQKLEAPAPVIRFHVDGTCDDGFTFDGTAENPPFAIFDEDRQENVVAGFKARAEAQRVADELNMVHNLPKAK